MKTKKVLITGAAGNLGSLAARYFLENSSVDLNLMYHNKEIEKEVGENKRVSSYKCDLSKKETLGQSMKDVNVIIHFAGILFKASPEKFLPITNTQYFENLIDVAKMEGIKKVILISFPHVEGHTYPHLPSTDRTDLKPISVHSQTRLEEEIILLSHIETPVILRVGMVYGSGILMPDGARWFARRNLLGVWKEATFIHLISKDDFCESLLQATVKNTVKGIYNIGDDGIQTLQEYLHFACKQWKTFKPWTMPLWMIYTAAWFSELISTIFRIKSPLTKDFIDIGRVNYYGDTRRMKDELIAKLKYRNMVEGKDTF